MEDRAPARQALVVGGTGLLRGTCLALSDAGWDVAVVARERVIAEILRLQRKKP